MPKIASLSGNALAIAIYHADICDYDGRGTARRRQAWVIDQMVRALYGCDFDEEKFVTCGQSADYLEFLKENPDWDQGIYP